jgi:hypothetical protein
MPPPESRGFKSGGSKPMTSVILSVAETIPPGSGVTVGATEGIEVGPVGAWASVGAAVGGAGAEVGVGGAAALQEIADNVTRTKIMVTIYLSL